MLKKSNILTFQSKQIPIWYLHAGKIIFQTLENLEVAWVVKYLRRIIQEQLESGLEVSLGQADH